MAQGFPFLFWAIVYTQWPKIRTGTPGPGQGPGPACLALGLAQGFPFLFWATVHAQWPKIRTEVPGPGPDQAQALHNKNRGSVRGYSVRGYGRESTWLSQSVVTFFAVRG